MRNQQQPQSCEPFQEMRSNVNMLVGLCQIIGKPMEVWLRRPGTWGDHFAGHQMVLGWLFIPVFTVVLFPQESPVPMVTFWGLTTFWLIVHRIKGWQLRRKGYRPHSRYTGCPWIPWVSEINAKCNWEPTLVMALFPVVLFNVPLGAYFLVSGSALFLAAGWQRAADSARLRQMRDARLEQQWLMEKMQSE
jgi:hypothetical protein